MSEFADLEGLAAAAHPIDGDADAEPIPGRIVQIREESAGDETQYRVVLDTGQGLLDTRKTRVEVV